MFKCFAAFFEGKDEGEVVGGIRGEADHVVEDLGDVLPAAEGARLAIDQQDEGVVSEGIEAVGAGDDETAAPRVPDDEVARQVGRHPDEGVGLHLHPDRAVLPQLVVGVVPIHGGSRVS